VRVPTKRLRLVASVLMTFAFLVAACADQPDEAVDGDTPAAQDPPDATDGDAGTDAPSDADEGEVQTTSHRLDEETEVTLALNPALISYLPFFVAQEKGYFADNNLSVKVIEYQGSANTQIPLIARGDIDFATAVTGPAIFSQFAEGFDVRLLAAVSEAREGWLDPSVLVVRRDVWDEQQLEDPSDLEGISIDAAAEGSPIDFLVRKALEAAGLTEGDVTLSYRGRTPADWQQLLANDVVEVAGMVEPVATQIESAGTGTRWLSYADVIPGYQETLLVASPDMAAKENVVLAFTNALLRAAQDVAESEGDWTEELLTIAADSTGLPTEVIEGMGPVPYSPPEGEVDVQALAEVQSFWLDAGLLQGEIEVADMVEEGVAARARPQEST